MCCSLPPGEGLDDGGEKDDGRVSFTSQTAGGGSRVEETRLCTACCLVQSVKVNDEGEETPVK